MNELVIPSEMESEIALIGCVFLDESILYQVADMLDAEDFYFQKNKLIYKAMLDLLKKGQNIDVTTVVSKLTNDNILEQCGGL